MALSGSPGSGFRLDIQQILSEAQYRWLRPAEICEILQNNRNFHISSEPPYKPLSGSLFLFDRKALRYFRKDGHNWRKKKDGKTIKEAHEKLKVGSIDMLHCYYAHGEEDECFQRRSYWMLEQDLMHIVFVHYLDVKRNKTNASYIKDTEKTASTLHSGNKASFSFPTNYEKTSSVSTDSTSPTSTLTSTREDAESEDSFQASSRIQFFPQEPPARKADTDLSRSRLLLSCSGSQSICGMDMSISHRERPISGSERAVGIAAWEEDLEYRAEYKQTLPPEPLMCPSDNASRGILHEVGNVTTCQHVGNESARKQELGSSASSIQAHGQLASEDHSLHLHINPVDHNLIMDSDCEIRTRLFEQQPHPENLEISSEHLFPCFNEKDVQPEQGSFLKQLSDFGPGYVNTSGSENVMTAGTENYPFIVKWPLLDGSQQEEGLKKADSFSRWMTKELGDVEELHIESTHDISWSVIEESGEVLDGSAPPIQRHLDTDSLNPSLSQDQLFSIIDFSPCWAYSNLETEVVVTGTFLKSHDEVAKWKWSCMFGEVEVPAEILEDGSLHCHAPPHKAGQVPFYVSCSNRLACSEVREFEYRDEFVQGSEVINLCGGNASEMLLLHMRLERLLSLGSNAKTSNPYAFSKDKQLVVRKLNSLIEEEKSYLMVKFHEELLKEKLHSWLLYKVTEDGKGPNVLDEEGQGVLHLAAALGYNWALRPTMISGVHIDFRDVNGWTGLHWAAFSGREDTVAALVSLGAATGALTDPSPECPLGRTPADLASGNGHKGISGFLAESSLTTYLASLTVNDLEENDDFEICGISTVRTVSERSAIPTTASDVPDLSLKDSLAAVRNAARAASRIHQIFRMQSFERSKFVEYGSEGPSSDEHTLSHLAAKTCRLGQSDKTSHAAVVCIQKKFRGWKKRKEFLLIKQRIVKIQAHVRGHQVRKKYKSITWSVGILEKVILRWRRKGSGLRGFRSNAVVTGPSEEEMPLEHDYDFLKDGRKQTEERLQKALARVKSMVQYPEARAQYRRLLTVSEGFREAQQDVPGTTQDGVEDMVYGDEDLIDFETLLDEDTFMSIAFE